jgi:1,4-alpha-glucan branching enzyme
MPANKTSIQPVIYDISTLTDYDIYLFKQGNNFRLHEKLGAHLRNVNGAEGTHFAVWAPNAQSVFVVGDFNGWNGAEHGLKLRQDGSGIWEGFIAGLCKGQLYKYHIVSNNFNHQVDKRDPFAFYCERPPRTASIIWDLDYKWNDADWLSARNEHNSRESPMCIYEVHPGSWKQHPATGAPDDPDDCTKFLTYTELADQLGDYVKDIGFTHIELTPVMEHPFYPSWGYQCLGYFAPTSRYGTPQEFMYLIDRLHQLGIGVILDWVPSHFPTDEHGLSYFDGTHLFEHADPRQGYHPDWKSYIFNYGRNEVRSFLISSAIFWLEKYHADGIRVDAVASMLYLDYSRKLGEWIPNKYGGRENIDAIDFLKIFNTEAYKVCPNVQTYAEESTAWPLVTRPPWVGGLGFGLKWNMGWMHDTLKYFSADPIYRKFLHNDLTFSIWYAFYENFVLALSHDEVVHGKGSLIGKMSGDDPQRFANLRLLFGYMYGHPGKKLLFMGMEFAQRKEWNHETALQWRLLEFPPHQGIQKWVKRLNELVRAEPALYELDFEDAGFEWIDCHDSDQSVISFIRKPKSAAATILVVCNFTPVERSNYRVGVPFEGSWELLLNSDAAEYGGWGKDAYRSVQSERVPFHKREQSVSLALPPLAVLFLKYLPGK